MIGAGVFSAFGPAARAAGSGLLIGLALAAGVAYCNAVASAQLAARVPDVGRHVRLRPRAARRVVGVPRRLGVRDRQDRVVRGDGADVRGVRVVPARLWSQRRVALAAVVVLTGANLRGISRTARLARVLVAVSIAALRRRRRRRSPASGNAGSPIARRLSSLGVHGGVYGVLQAAGLLFFAFAGYARIATLGEEVRDPARTIPRAIPIALGITVALTSLVGVAALAGGRADGARGELGADRGSGRGRRCGLGRAGRAGRSGGREPRRAARADRGHRPDGARDGAERRPAALARRRRPAPPGAAARRARGRGGRGGARADDRPARSDRLLVVRRARLLRRRERIGVHADAPSSAAGRAGSTSPASSACVVLVVTLPAVVGARRRGRARWSGSRAARVLRETGSGL